jgi:hypothetical protein
MSTKTRSTSGTGRLSLPLFIVAVLILIAFVGWIAYRSFGPAPIPPAPPKNANEIRMEKIYKESGGDIEKLSPEDRQWLHDYSGGREQQAMQYYKTSAQR